MAPNPNLPPKDSPEPKEKKSTVPPPAEPLVPKTLPSASEKSEIPPKAEKEFALRGSSIKLNVNVGDWTVRVPMGTENRVEEVAEQVQARWERHVTSSFPLQQTAVALEAAITALQEAFDSPDPSQTAPSAVRGLVGTLQARVEVVDSLATHTSVWARSRDGEEWDGGQNLLGTLGDTLEDLQRSVVQATILQLRNPSPGNRGSVEGLLRTIVRTSARVSQALPRVRRVVLRVKEAVVQLDPNDLLGDVLDSEAFLLALLGPSGTSEGTEREEGPKQGPGDNPPVESAAASLAREAEEEESKWASLLASLQDDKLHSLNSTASTSNNPPNTITNTTNTTTSNTTTANSNTSPTPSDNANTGKGVSEKRPIGEVMLKVMCDLSEALGEGTQTEVIKKEFPNFVRTTGDTSRQLAKFLEHVLGAGSKLSQGTQILGNDTSVLKAINQSIIATPFVRLKAAFPPSLPWEDVAGTWGIRVRVEEGKGVTVIHSKKGVSKEGPPKGGYEFSWELEMKFPWSVDSLLSASLRLTHLQFEKGILDSHRKQVQLAFDSFVVNKL